MRWIALVLSFLAVPFSATGVWPAAATLAILSFSLYLFNLCGAKRG